MQKSWKHLLVEPDGTVHVLPYDHVNSSLVFHKVGGKLYRSMPGCICPEENVMLLDVALRLRDSRNAAAAKARAQNNERRQRAQK